MASIQNIAGTSYSSFTIGNNGITILYGDVEPKSYLGKVGDIYVQVNADNKSFGRFYYKNVRNGIAQWDFIKNYTFDSPIINESEDDGSNDFKISIQRALQPSSNPSNEDEVHNKYGVVRFATNDEATSGVKENIVINPKQLIDNIVRLIAEHNDDNDEGDAERHPYIQNRITAETNRATNRENELDDKIDAEINRATIRENELDAKITAETSTRESEDIKLQEQIDTINARKDVFDVVSDKNALLNYPIKDSGITVEDIVKVLDDGDEENRQTYYRYTTIENKNNYQKYISIDEKHIWGYVGSDAASYTKAEIETIKTNIYDKISEEDEKLDNRITSEVATLNKKIDNEVKDLEDAIDLKANASDVYTKDEITGLFEDASGNVDDLLATKQDKIGITISNNGQFLSNNGSTVEWKTVEDISYVKDLHDVSLNEPKDGEVMIYSESEQKWVNGYQTTATIKYW
jgi:hypothetical protein